MTSDPGVEPDVDEPDDGELPPVPWPAAALCVVSLLVGALSFADFYRYTPGPVFARVCNGSSSCPDTLDTTNAWSGILGWLPVVIALLAAAVVVAAVAQPARSGALTAAAVVLYAAGAAVELAALGEIPDYQRGVLLSRAQRVSYDAIVSEGHAWGYWASLALLVAALALGAVHITALLRSRAETNAA